MSGQDPLADFERMMAGVAVAQRLASATIGPCGRSVLAARDYGVPIMRDAVSAIRPVCLEDRAANMGVSFAQEVAVRTSDEAGDGTATAVLIFGALLQNGRRLLAAGLDGATLGKGLRSLACRAETMLEAMARDVTETDDLMSIATQACGGDPILGEIVVRALADAGTGRIVVLVATSSDTTVEVVQGLAIQASPVHDLLTAKWAPDGTTVHTPIVYVYDGIVSEFDRLIPSLEKAAEGPTLLILAHDVVGEALEGLLKNRREGIVDVVALRIGGRGDTPAETLADVAAALDVSLEGPDHDLNGSRSKNIKHSPLVEVVVGSTEATFSWQGDGGQKLIEHRAKLERAIASGGNETQRLRERLANLEGRTVKVSVGGYTSIVAKERRDRLAVGLKAAEAALSTGVIAGGGAALVRIANDISGIDDLTLAEKCALDAFRSALHAPFDTICRNAGITGPSARDALLKATEHSAFDLKTETVVDPTNTQLMEARHVVATALRHAVGTAAPLLNAQVIVCQKAG